MVELSGISKIAAGGYHTCALTTAGAVKCWGDNRHGQLGDNSIVKGITPVDVSGLASGVAGIAASWNHTCALTAVGGVKCWGYNNFGQLGDNSTTDRLTPVDVSGLTSGVAAIAAGGGHTCALTMAGGVKCWGYNAAGQLGDNSTTDRLTPVDVSGLASGVVSITVGGYHTCALTTAGGMKCWGYNSFGQLGDISTTNRLTPVDVLGLASGAAAITAGASHTCALTTAGGVKCWGVYYDNSYGLNNSYFATAPIDVPDLTSGVAAIAAGGAHSCALTTVGGVKCWGANYYSQLGDYSTTNRLTPVDVFGLASGMVAIAAGGDHTCALTAAGGVKCWGYNAFGQMGDGTAGTWRMTAVDVSGLASGVAAVSAGGSHSCALATAGGVKCWGSNSLGQLGDNTTTQRLTPVDVSSLDSGVAAIAAGSGHTCALTTAGGVKCWGSNQFGQLGDNSTTIQRLTPVDVSDLASGAAAIAAGGGHTCALTTAGGVKCWGWNGAGQLGDNTFLYFRGTPVDVLGLASGVAAIAAGAQHTCALTMAGGVKCWGANWAGQLGDNSRTHRATPVDVSGLASGVAAITAGSGHTCAITTAGGVKCWGSNQRQLDDQYIDDSLTPADVSGLASEVAAIAAGGEHTCAITTAGGVKCWGYLLDGFSTDLDFFVLNYNLAPVDVVGLPSGVAAIAAGAQHTCALTMAGGVKCWGDNSFGQVGDGTARIRPIPVPVLMPGDLVVEFYNSILDHYFITADPSEAAAIDNGSAGPGWSRTGNTFQSAGRVFSNRKMRLKRSGSEGVFFKNQSFRSSSSGIDRVERARIDFFGMTKGWSTRRNGANLTSSRNSQPLRRRIWIDG